MDQMYVCMYVYFTGGQGCQIFCKIYKAPFKIYTDFFGAICIFPSKCLRLLEQICWLWCFSFLISHISTIKTWKYAHSLSTTWTHNMIWKRLHFLRYLCSAIRKFSGQSSKYSFSVLRFVFYFFMNSVQFVLKVSCFLSRWKKATRCYSVSYILVQYTLTHSRSFFVLFFKVPRLHIFLILYLFQTTLQLMFSKRKHFHYAMYIRDHYPHHCCF